MSLAQWEFLLARKKRICFGSVTNHIGPSLLSTHFHNITIFFSYYLYRQKYILAGYANRLWALNLLSICLGFTNHFISRKHLSVCNITATQNGFVKKWVNFHHTFLGKWFLLPGLLHFCITAQFISLFSHHWLSDPFKMICNKVKGNNSLPLS